MDTFDTQDILLVVATYNDNGNKLLFSVVDPHQNLSKSFGFYTIHEFTEFMLENGFSCTPFYSSSKMVGVLAAYATRIKEVN